MKKIIRDKSILSGRPIVAGTHLSVSFILKHLADGQTPHAISRQFPQLRQDDIIMAIKYAADVVDKQPFEEEAKPPAQ